MNTARRRASRPRRQYARGFVLIALLVMLVMGGLYFLVSNLTPEAIEERRQQKTNEALVQARDALLGYALQFRDYQLTTGTSNAVYGYFPMPDMGEAVNQNAALSLPCSSEGCAKLNPSGVPATATTYVGQFPWQTLGTGPLQDGGGNCLWYAVSGNHKALNNPLPMNWDTLGLIDSASAMNSVALGTPPKTGHEAPLAMVFAPGPTVAGQAARQYTSATQCGGDYTTARFLDTTNDRGMAITPDDFFGALRKSANFRNDINSMLENMVGCLRDDLAAGSSFKPVAMPDPPTSSPLIDPASVPYKASGRIYSNNCYDDTATSVNTINPKGYFTHYRDQLFVAACPGAVHNVNGAACAGALIFAGQRNSASTPPQSRNTAIERNTPSMYLENGPAASANNLASFASLQGLNYASCAVGDAASFAGDTSFSTLASGQTAHQDIVRCIPSGASLSVAAPVVAAAAGNIQLAAYAPGSRTLTLGSGATTSNYGAAAASLSACAWTPEAQAAGSGFRSYFRFRIRRVGEGFTFAVIDGDRNGNNVCGAAQQHLGYSGDSGNVSFPYIQAPKLAVEFDFSRNSNFTESGSTLSNGRNDPCYTCGSGTTDRHIAVVYWGYGADNPAIPLYQELQDDNVHGFPLPPDTSARPAPRNPYYVLPYTAPGSTDPIPGVAPLNRNNFNQVSQREFHARLELTRSFTQPSDPKNGATSVQLRFWIEPQPGADISAMSYIAGSPPTLSVTTSSVHNLSSGATVVIKDAVPTGFNGEFPVTVTSTTTFIATLPAGTPNPGPYISAIAWGDVSSGTDRATVTSANHGLNTGDIITISGAIPTEYNGNRTITWISNNQYRFGLELNYEPGNMSPAVATPKALTPRAIALANTTRPMSALDATALPLVANTATIYDEQKSACAASAPLCPNGQSCGSDNMCYRPAFRNLRVGFTTAERPTTSLTTARDQLIEIKDRATTWLQ